MMLTSIGRICRINQCSSRSKIKLECKSIKNSTKNIQMRGISFTKAASFSTSLHLNFTSSSLLFKSESKVRNVIEKAEESLSDKEKTTENLRDLCNDFKWEEIKDYLKGGEKTEESASVLKQYFLRNADNLKRVVELIDLLNERGVDQDWMYDFVLKRLNYEQRELAESFFKKIPTYLVDVDTYNFFIYLYGKEGDERAVKWWDKLIAREDIEPNSKSYLTLSLYYIRIQNQGVIEYLANKAPNNDFKIETDRIFATYGTFRDIKYRIDRMIANVKKMDQNLSTDDYNYIIQRFLDKGSPILAEEYLVQMKEDEVSHNEETNNLVGLIYSLKSKEEFKSWKESCLKEEKQMSPTTWRIITKYYADQGQIKEFDKHWEMAMKRKVNFSFQDWERSLKLKEGNQKETNRVYSEMKKNGVIPSEEYLLSKLKRQSEEGSDGENSWHADYVKYYGYSIDELNLYLSSNRNSENKHQVERIIIDSGVWPNRETRKIKQGVEGELLKDNKEASL
eukprot:TRINITY_DN7040_c0_g1_i1.p1 TRINITY_DN7040_c0_g1~~TRINITY_DN7040_c0_g1_i1.p1  ORF type:complete len:508 (+),score=126.71 TRINITY_DN7040_c0_g1_i1:45-1568(+)